MSSVRAPIIESTKRLDVVKRLAAVFSLAVITALVFLSLPKQAIADGKQRVSLRSPSPTSATSVRQKVRAFTLSLRTSGAGIPAMYSSAVLVTDFNDGRTLYAKNTQNVAPIASITKLMTAMVVLDAALPLEAPIPIEIADFDFLKYTHSRLGMGAALARRELLRLALMSSENRAAAALARAYPGGLDAFIAAMNSKALELGMSNTRFVDSTGLSSSNVSTAQDLTKMVHAAYAYPLIREFTTTSGHAVESLPGHYVQYNNSNRLVRESEWQIGLSKTGYIRQAGRCLVMQVKIAARPVIIVLLDAADRQSQIGDATRIKQWLENSIANNV